MVMVKIQGVRVEEGELPGIFPKFKDPKRECYINAIDKTTEKIIGRVRFGERLKVSSNTKFQAVFSIDASEADMDYRCGLQVWCWTHRKQLDWKETVIHKGSFQTIWSNEFTLEPGEHRLGLYLYAYYIGRYKQADGIDHMYITVEKTVIKTLPIVTRIETDKEKYEPGEWILVTVYYKGSGGNTPTRDNIIITVDGREVERIKDVVFYPNEERREFTHIRIYDLGRHEICAKTTKGDWYEDWEEWSAD